MPIVVSEHQSHFKNHKEPIDAIREHTISGNEVQLLVVTFSTA
jgi:hypothetical protein